MLRLVIFRIQFHIFNINDRWCVYCIHWIDVCTVLLYSSVRMYSMPLYTSVHLSQWTLHSDSEAYASEFPEYLEEMVPLYCTHSYVCIIFKSSTINHCVTCHDRIKPLNICITWHMVQKWFLRNFIEILKRKLQIF